MKKLVWIAALVFCVNFVFAQDEDGAESPRNDKVFAGGNFGLSLGNYTIINLSPQVGYQFNRFVSAGVGLNIQYASQKQKLNGRNYSKTTQGITGLNLFGRIYPVKSVFLQVQPEANYVFGRITYFQPTEQTYKMDAEIVPSFLLGGGVAMPSGRGSFIATILYDVVQHTNSPYGNRPFVNFGYNFPF
ncbi:MAG TPA: hypothetical protein VM871_02435 [Flavisolibacter sp.]|nr:hypothetical protein [Flavisolibacter sp.]